MQRYKYYRIYTNYSIFINSYSAKFDIYQYVYSLIDVDLLICQCNNMENEAKINTSILAYCHIEVFHYYFIQVLSYSEYPLVLLPPRITY